MPDWYPYLKNHNYSLDAHIDIRSTSKFIVRRETNRWDARETKYTSYYEYAAYPSFVNWFYDRAHYSSDNIIAWHEQFLDGGRKLLFDIDCEDAQFDIISLIQKLENLIKSFFNKFYNVLLTDNDIVICHSPDPSLQKYSFHIIVDNYYLANHRECKHVAQFICSQLTAQESSYIDLGPYKSIASLRILGSFKLNTQRRKWLYRSVTCPDIVMPPNANQQEKQEINTQMQLFVFRCSLVTVISHCKLLPRLLNYLSKIARGNFTLITQQQAEDIHRIMPNSEAFKIRAIEPGMITLNRIKSSYCVICQRLHNSDNSYIVIKNNLVFLKCHRSSGSHRLKFDLEGEATPEIVTTPTIPLIPQRYRSLDNNVSVELQGRTMTIQTSSYRPATNEYFNVLDISINDRSEPL